MLVNTIWETYDEKCKSLVREGSIRFAGVINLKGKLVAGGFKEGLLAYEQDKTRLEKFIKFVHLTSSRKEFDDTLGSINYLAARRNNIVLISFPFPMTGMTLLVSAEIDIDIERLASHVVDVFSKDYARLGN